MTCQADGCGHTIYEHDALGTAGYWCALCICPFYVASKQQVQDHEDWIESTGMST